MPRFAPSSAWLAGFTNRSALPVSAWVGFTSVAAGSTMSAMTAVVAAGGSSVAAVIALGLTTFGCYHVFMWLTPWVMDRRLEKIAGDAVWAPRTAVLCRAVVHVAYQDAGNPEDHRYLVDLVEKRFADVYRGARPIGVDPAKHLTRELAVFEETCDYVYGVLAGLPSASGA